MPTGGSWITTSWPSTSSGWNEPRGIRPAAPGIPKAAMTMTTPPTPRSDVTTVLSVEERGFPFETELSLAPLARFWSEIVAQMGSIRGEIGKLVEGKLRSAPDLLRPITDPETFAKHRDLIES